MMRAIAISILIIGITTTSFSQQKKKATASEGGLYVSLIGERNGKKIVIAKDYGRTVSQDSLKMAEKITAYYKVGQKITAVKDIVYDSYFLSSINSPTIILDVHGLAFDTSIWTSCLDSMNEDDQIVFQVREITLDDGTKIQNPKLAKENKATYIIFSNPNFPAGGWTAKANHWIDYWKENFKLKDNSFYKLDDKSLELYAKGIVYTIKEKAVK